MNNPLAEKGLPWAVWDRAQVVSAAVSFMLQETLPGQGVKPRWLRSGTPHLAELLASGQPLSLVLWVVEGDADIPGVCEGLLAVSQRWPAAPRVCYCRQLHAAWYPALVEAGGQVIVGDLGELQRGLPQVLAHTARLARAYHPLTAGIFERLPGED